MKKFLFSLVAVLATLSGLNAQDVNQATDFYNNAVNFYSAGNLDSALKNFVKAHEIAKQCGEEGAEIVTDCENNIPVLGNQLAKSLASEGKYSDAVAQLNEVAGICASMGLTDQEAKLKKMIPQFYMQQANQAVKSKNFDEALAAYDNVIALEPSNGKALLNKGQILNSKGDSEGALAAFESAMANGQEKAAKRQISNLFLKKAKAASAEKKYEMALEYSKKAISYDENEANAYYLGGIAAQALKKDSEAISLFEKYLALKPSSNNSQAVRQVVEALKKANAK